MSIPTANTSAMAHLLIARTKRYSRSAVALPRIAKIGMIRAALMNGIRMLNRRISAATKLLPVSWSFFAAPTTLRVSLVSSRVWPRKSIVALIVSAGFVSPGQRRMSDTIVSTRASTFRFDICILGQVRRGAMIAFAMRSVIISSGIGVPGNVVTNDALARIMDTSDEWMRTRSGIQERRYVDRGQGSAELGMEGGKHA